MHVKRLLMLYEVVTTVQKQDLHGHQHNIDELESRELIIIL